MKSSFNFLNYKITKFNFESARHLNIVQARNPFSPWEFHISISNPVYLQKEMTYVCGLILKGSHDVDGKKLISFESEIVGLFKVDEPFEAAMEENLAKTQGPAILLPFLRAAIIGYFASSGYGHISIPLINIQKLAFDTLKEVEIQRIE